MSRYVSLARKVFRTNPVVSRASGPVQIAKFTFPVGLRNFSADAHAGHGADEVRQYLSWFSGAGWRLCFFLQPFLDPKMVTDRIIEVIKNFEKVLWQEPAFNVSTIYHFLLYLTGELVKNYCRCSIQGGFGSGFIGRCGGGDGDRRGV